MIRHTLGCEREYSSLRCDRNIVELLLDYTESRPRREYTGQYIFDHVLSVTRAGPTIWAPGQANNLAALKTNTVQTFSAYDRAGSCRDCGQFSGKFCRI
jgi:hypothetical protein